MKQSFNAGWVVKRKINRFLELVNKTTSEPEEVTLPHDAMIATTRDPEGSHMNAYFPDGVWEYTKTFDVPDEWRDRRVRLQFEGVYRDAVVFVNDDFAVSEPYGYSEFVVELDPFLRYGAPNTIKVDCRAGDDSRWYSGAGIYRPVHLWVQDRVHLEIDGVVVTTPEVDEAGAVIDIAAEVANQTHHTVTVWVTNELRGSDGTLLASGCVPVTLRPRTTVVARHRLYLHEPARWSPDRPELHTCTTSVTGGRPSAGDLERSPLDETVTTFGIRTLQLDSRHGLRINGETVKLRGACIHHDNGPIGAATIDRAEERRVELLKAAGFNAIRSAHNPSSRSLLGACDRLGVVVMDEAYDTWTESKRDHDHALRFEHSWRNDLASMVRKNRNHPSVVMYSTGNEIPEVGSPLGAALARELADHVRSLDPTRYVTNGVQPFLAIRDLLSHIGEFLPAADDPDGPPTGVNSQMTAWAWIKDRMMASPMVDKAIEEVCASLDVAGYNYLDVRYAADHVAHPDRVIVGSETYSTTIARAWPEILASDHVIGDFTWTGWDYIGEVGVGRIEYEGDRPAGDGSPQFMGPYPWLLAHCGDLDITGFRRPQSYLRETVFGLRSTPFIAVRRPANLGREVTHSGPWSWTDTIASWNWPGYENTIVPIEVYSDAEEIEVLLDGHSIGRQPCGSDHGFTTHFDVAYRPGELTAIAYRNGIETGRSSLVTPTGDRRLLLECDRLVIGCDHGDLVYITVSVADPGGVLDLGVDLSVSVEVHGPATLQGFASAEPTSLESYRSATARLYDGRALAVLRPTGPGTIEAMFTADGLPAETVHVICAADQLP